ncbi:hypothetical protein H9I48_02295 [Wolbachia pipientis]|nr:hypothetical protein [Wolbachia pipientis]MBC6686073.1 hypothetical protein [Wolbachia pipientis]
MNRGMTVKWDVIPVWNLVLIVHLLGKFPGSKWSGHWDDTLLDGKLLS